MRAEEKDDGGARDVDLAVGAGRRQLLDLLDVAVVRVGRVELSQRNLGRDEDAGARRVEQDGLALAAARAGVGGRLEPIDHGLRRAQVVGVGGGDDCEAGA